MDGKTVRLPASVSLSAPATDSGSATFADTLPAQRGDYGDMDGLVPLLHAERLEMTGCAWESKPPPMRARSREIAAQVNAVL